jgi:hypothetical protein
MFPYYDAVVIDTPILDDACRDTMICSDDIHDRLGRAESFRNYLDRQWSAAAFPDMPYDWARTSEALRNDLQRTREDATAQKTRRR